MAEQTTHQQIDASLNGHQPEEAVLYSSLDLVEQKILYALEYKERVEGIVAHAADRVNHGLHILHESWTKHELAVIYRFSPQFIKGTFVQAVTEQRLRVDIRDYLAQLEIIASTDPRLRSDRDPTDALTFTDAHAILRTPVVPRRWLLPGIIADGLTIIGGSPKGGKSYLAYALAMAVSKYGRWCNHWAVEQGKVIYVSLEDDENDTHLRLEELDKDFSIPAGKLLFVHGSQTMPAFGSGLLEWVEHALQQHQPRLFIIDPISYLYVLKKTGGQFEETKDMLFPLRWLGRQYNCAIVCLDHRRKRSRDDTSMVDTLYGSVAKQAVADGLIMVNKDQDEIELDLTIRSGQTQKLYVNFVFEDGQCFLTYKAAETQTASYSDFRTRVIDTVYAALQPIAIGEILAAMEMPDTRQSRNNVAQILYRHCKTKEIEKTVRGRYTRGEGRDV